jgi:hypothetical protein
MNVLNSLLFGGIASLVIAKLALLAVATVLFVRALGGQTSERRLAWAPAPIRQRKLAQRS